MISSNVHYEVLGQRGAAWTILAVVDDQETAVRKAQEARVSFRSVKVMRERFDKDSNTYRSGQIFFSGAESKPSRYNDEEMPSICWRVEDFYSYEGRRAINRLLRQELLEWGLTATELLHSPEMVQRLQDNGTSLQRAVQQTAIAQVKETGQGVQERIKQIYELIEKGVAALRRDSAAFPGLNEGGLDDLIVQIAEKESRSYLLHGALAGYLAGARDFNDKMSRMLGMVRADHPPWVHEVADTFVAELLSIGKVLHVLIGNTSSLKHEIEGAAFLSIGEVSAQDERFTPDARMVNRLIAAGKLPCTQQALTRYMIEAIKGKSRLVEGDILAESKAVGELASVLKRPDGEWIGKLPMVEAIGRRCARWLHPEAISELLAGAEDPKVKFDRLLKLEANVFGNQNKRKLGEFLMPIVISPQGEMYLTTEGGTVTQKLRRLKVMQDAVIGSGLPDMHRQKLAIKLDELACKVIRSTQLIERVTQGEGTVVEKCFSLLRMVVDGYFTRGKADEMARTAIRRSLAIPDFVSGFLGAARTKEEKMMKLDALSRLLTQAGIETPPADAPAPASPARSDDPSAASA
ncbi:hypothetical protein [Minwuia sp.]|uniref:hypothetical protein n=1 Tax=Minwuia sp. TaxID=2493630 RepID=UPI003A94CA73